MTSQLAEHEAFLRAIFDAPYDDTPRLVYADYLEENGLPMLGEAKVDFERARFRAALIRAQCALARAEAEPQPDPGTIEALRQNVAEVASRVGGWPLEQNERGFPIARSCVRVGVTELLDPTELRVWAITGCPHWFATTSVKVNSGVINSTEPADALFGLAVFARIISLNLAGQITAENTEEYTFFNTYKIVPRITTVGVVALSRHQAMRRITSLNLTNNDLDDDAARALVRSPYLVNLQRLRLLEGNRLRGKVWQQVIERFGEDVVG